MYKFKIVLKSLLIRRLSVTNLSQKSETLLTDLFESNSEPLFSNQETVEVPTQSESQPVRTTRIRKKPAHLKDHLI